MEAKRQSGYELDFSTFIRELSPTFKAEMVESLMRIATARDLELNDVNVLFSKAIPSTTVKFDSESDTPVGGK